MAEGNKFSDLTKSPMLIAMLLGGIALVIGVPYLALQTLPGIANPITGEKATPKGDRNPGLNTEELATLPEELKESARVILSQEEGVMPEPLIELPEASGPGLIYPVTETVDTLQPALTWNAFSPGPFKVVVKDHAGALIATTQNVPTTTLVIPKKLTPGTTYTWSITAADGESQEASFVVMSAEDTIEWARIRSDFKESHLALGLMAEHYGLLSTAEREYKEVVHQVPQAEAPARLLSNVLGLRD